MKERKKCPNGRHLLNSSRMKRLTYYLICSCTIANWEARNIVDMYTFLCLTYGQCFLDFASFQQQIAGDHGLQLGPRADGQHHHLHFTVTFHRRLEGAQWKYATNETNKNDQILSSTRPPATLSLQPLIQLLFLLLLFFYRQLQMPDRIPDTLPSDISAAQSPANACPCVACPTRFDWFFVLFCGLPL